MFISKEPRDQGIWVPSWDRAELERFSQCNSCHLGKDSLLNKFTKSDIWAAGRNLLTNASYSHSKNWEGRFASRMLHVSKASQKLWRPWKWQRWAAEALACSMHVASLGLCAFILMLCLFKSLLEVSRCFYIFKKVNYIIMCTEELITKFFLSVFYLERSCSFLALWEIRLSLWHEFPSNLISM